MKGEIAECQVPSATVTSPIVQVYSHNGAKRLVVVLPNSAILVSQEWLTTVAGWTFFSRPKPGLENSARENKVYPAGGKHSFVLSMKKWLAIFVQRLLLDGNGRHSKPCYSSFRTLMARIEGDVRQPST